jgi:hypothetical protein
MDDEFAGGALDGKWSWVNQGTSSAAVANGRLTLSLSSTGDQIQGIVQNAPAGNWTFRAKCIPAANTAGDYNNAGLMVVMANGVTAYCGGPANKIGTIVQGSLTGSTTTSAIKGPGVPYGYMELIWDNTAVTLTVNASLSGETGTFDTILVLAPGAAPAKIGLGGGTFAQPAANAVKRRFEWFRRIA